MHHTMPERTSRTSGRLARRVGVMVLGVLAGAAVICGCSNSSTTPPLGSSAISGTTPVAVAPSGTSGAPATSGDQVAPSQPQAQSPINPSETAAPQPITSVPADTAQQPPANHPAPGTTFAGEGLTIQQATDLQKSVDGGHQPWRLDRVQVAKSFVQGRFGWTSVQTSTDAPTVVVVTNQDGSKVALNLAQPATQGDHGIWVVETGVWS